MFTDKQTNLKTNQHYQKHNLRDSPLSSHWQAWIIMSLGFPFKVQQCCSSNSALISFLISTGSQSVPLIISFFPWDKRVRMKLSAFSWSGCWRSSAIMAFISCNRKSKGAFTVLTSSLRNHSGTVLSLPGKFDAVSYTTAHANNLQLLINAHYCDLWNSSVNTWSLET